MSKVLLFRNGKIFTAHEEQLYVESVVVGEDGKIIFVGDEKEAMSKFKNAEAVDLNGKMLLPGFIDAHNHFLNEGEVLEFSDVRYPKIQSKKNLIDFLRKEVTRLKNGQTLTAFGMDPSKYDDDKNPTRWDLDKVSIDHYIYVVHVSGHYVLANSKAVDFFNVRKDTPDPTGGKIIKNDSGEPTGLFLDAAQAIVRPVDVDIGNHGPNFHVKRPLEELVGALEKAQNEYLACGITSVGDAQVTKRELSVYYKAHKDHKLKIRVVCMPLSHQLTSYLYTGIRTGFGDDLLRIGPMKFYEDGSLIGGTAKFSEPYGENGEYSGILYWEDDIIQKMIEDAYSGGWGIGVHAQGDKAIGVILNTFQRVRDKEGKHSNNILRIEHCGYPTMEQIMKMSRLGVYVISQPNYLYDSGDEFLKRLGKRADSLYPLRTELENNVKMVISSDAPVTMYNPLRSIQAAVTRLTLMGKSIGGNEIITVEQALIAHTLNAAEALGIGETTGSITVGKYADLIVLDVDITNVDPKEISEGKVLLTMVGGNIEWGSLKNFA